MEIWLARHGETEWTVLRKHTSVTDVGLTPTGETAARSLGQALTGRRFAVVYSSPRRRALDTARLAGFADPLIDPLLEEFTYGEYEGRTTNDIRAERPDWDLWRDGCPGGETPDAVAARADRFLNELPGAGDDVLIFGHGHMLRVLAIRHLGLAPSEARHLALDTATLSVLGMEHEWPALRAWNLPVSNTRP